MTTNDDKAVIRFLLEEESIEKTLDLVKVSFRLTNTIIRDDWNYRSCHTTRRLESNGAIAELNGRFKEHGVGYHFVSNEIIRVDSEFLHTEAVKPALALLRGAAFKAPTRNSCWPMSITAMRGTRKRSSMRSRHLIAR